MNQLFKPSLAMLALFSALAALPMNVLRSHPQLLAQVTAEPTPTFNLQESVPPGTTLSINGSPSMAGINQNLEEGFEQRYPDTDVRHEANGDEQALQELRSGSIDLAALGRSLSEAEEDPSLTSIPVTREKIAVIVGRDNPFRGDLSFDDFAAIFRGEITNWSEVGGPNLPIRFVDRPAESATRLALGDYEIFSGQPFETGDNAVQVEEDDTAAVVRELGRDGISYAIASEVLEQNAVRPVSLDSTLPDDPRYPYSQPRNYIYLGEPSLPVEAFLGFATSDEGQAAVAEAKQTASANVTVGASRLPGGVALAPDGRFMVRGTEDGQLQWLDATGNPTETVIADAHRGAVSAVVISPDDQTVVSGGADGTLRRWDRSGNSLGEPMAGQGGPILSLALSPDGQTIASGNADGTVQRWAIADGKPLGNPVVAHDGPVQALHFPAGGQAFITGSSDGSLGFWNADGTAAGESPDAHPGGVTSITSSPDGQVLTTAGGDGSLRNWDRSTLQPRGGTIEAHEAAVSAVAYSPDGATLATAGANGTLQLWSPDGTPRLSEPVELEAPAASLGYTPEGQLVVGSSEQVALLDDQGQSVSNVETEAEDDDSATEVGSIWDRIRNLPPSAWWMLAAIPALLLLAGIAGALLGRRDSDDEDDTLEADLVPGSELSIDFSKMGNKLPVTAGPLPPDAAPPAGRPLPPEAELVPGPGEYSSAAPSKLEQARLDLAEGRRLMGEGHCDTALIYFNQAVEATEVERSKAEATGVPAQGLNATAALAQAERGHALALLGQANEAMDSYNAALQLDSSVIDAWVGKGRLLSTMGRYDEALFCFDTALELDQTSAAAWMGKGQALMQMGRQSEGQACLAKAADLGNGEGLPGMGFAPALYPGVMPEPVAPGAGGTPGPLPEAVLPEPSPSAGYDPDVPLELQQMVLGLPSADVEISSDNRFSSADVPPELESEVANLPGQAETAATVGSGAVTVGPLSITPGPVPSEAISPGPVPSEAISPDPVPSGAIGPGPLPPSTLEEELLSQVRLGITPGPERVPQGLPTDTGPVESAGATAIAEPPLRPAPVPVPPPVPVEPGDYVPPPPEAAIAGDSSGLEGLPPDVVAALASIPPSSPDSFGVVPTSAEAEAAPPSATVTKSWIRLSIDRQSDRFYAVWHIDASDRTRAKDSGGETMTLRLYDVTGRATQSALPPAVAEQRCRDDFAQDWYLPIPQWDRIYVVEVGYLSATGDWQTIAQSAEVAAITA
ncbi:substrate-binding domain-containing protein [Nodosilinea sp. LEGE 06152]|uniref:substrate-binding domain-containing protein n=1 Tax=Nodosilinea sp. LEGE 06152 TaxID=2777966 RepID=UPI00188168B8|nr:substrate-binding domain-containing protein [Nodosilinea sp. LEGE 06152]MBE9158999.1 substrate-binding domain-containing protein [Nodosilinea sp. LEGE 06152]